LEKLENSQIPLLMGDNQFVPSGKRKEVLMKKKLLTLKSIMVAVMLISILGSGCATMQPPTTREDNPQGPVITLDDQLVTVAKVVSGFGGMFFDDNGNLNVYMLKADEELSAHARQERHKHLQAVLEAVFGEDYLSRGTDRHPDYPIEPDDKDLPRIKIIKGSYNILQLAMWRADIDKALDLPGTVFTDLDEKQNRLRIGIESPIFHKRVQEVLAQQGVPPATLSPETPGISPSCCAIQILPLIRHNPC
jgi:hypothetical protein